MVNGSVSVKVQGEENTFGVLRKNLMRLGAYEISEEG